MSGAARTDDSCRLALFNDGRTLDRPIELGAYIETPIYDHYRLPLDRPIRGPAIIEQPTTTILLLEGQTATTNAAGDFLVAAA